MQASFNFKIKLAFKTPALAILEEGRVGKNAAKTHILSPTLASIHFLHYSLSTRPLSLATPLVQPCALPLRYTRSRSLALERAGKKAHAWPRLSKGVETVRGFNFPHPLSPARGLEAPFPVPITLQALSWWMGGGEKKLAPMRGRSPNRLKLQEMHCIKLWLGIMGAVVQLLL